MRLIRTTRKFGSVLALFALALQFYLSFGHIHLEDIYGPANIQLAANARIALPPDQALHALPDRPWGQSDEFCPICETMYFLGTSFVPEAPHFPPPLVRARMVEHVERVAAIFIAPRRPSFQSRAPPLA
jgi:hypothetical protein